MDLDQTNNEPADDSRADIAAAIDSLSSTDNTPAAPAAPAAPPPSAAAPSAPPAPSTPPANGGQTPASPAGTPSASPPVEPPQVALRMPASWKPDMRDHWGKMSREAQTEVLRREREINLGLQNAADVRRFQEQFQQIAAPYQQYIATHLGGDPIKGYADYLRTATILRSGTPQERAQAVAMAIGEYGIDIQALDTALAAMAQGQRFAPPQAHMQQQQAPRDPRVDALLAEREQEANERMAAELESFSTDPQNEFFQHVREEIADLLEFNAHRGVKMTLKQAYDRACKSSDEVQAILQQRAAAAVARQGQQRVQQARQAASSIGPGRAPQAVESQVKGDGSRRDDIAAAIEQLTPLA